MNRRRLVIALVLLALVGLGATIFWPAGEEAVESTSREVKPKATGQVFPFEPKALPSKPLIITSPSGHAVRFVRDGSPAAKPIDAVVGMAGIYPAPKLSATNDGVIGLPAPKATTLWGDEMRTYEVFAHTRDNSHGFWGEVSTDGLDEGEMVEASLLAASPLVVSVRDKNGEPVEGVEVRISRGFVGLVHLTQNTDSDGKAHFAGLPPGEYRVTLQKEGFAREMTALTHTAAQAALEVALERGSTRIGNGVLERLAKQVVNAGNRTVVDTSSDQADDAEQSTERIRSEVDLYVVDRTGSGVSGALVQLWKDGRKLFEGTSKGNTPVRVEIEAPFEGTIVTFDGRRGEGSAALRLTRADTTHETIVRLNQPLLSLDLPPGRVNARGRIEQILGVELVRDNDAWLADVLSRTSPAAKAGIERGDRIVWVRKLGQQYEALVEHGSQRKRVTLPQGG